MEKYDEFIKEAVSKKPKSSIKVGDCFLFNTNIQNISGIRNQIGEVIEVDEDPKVKAGKAYNPYGTNGNIVYTLRFTNPIKVVFYLSKRNYYGQWEQKMDWEESHTITFVKSQMTNTELIPAEYVDRFKKGEIARYKGSYLFENILKSINFKVNVKYCDMTYFDIDREKDDMITYIPVGKLKELDKKKDKNDTVDPYDGMTPNPHSGVMEEDDVKFYKAKFRQSSRIGRVLKKLNDSLTDPQVENFVNEYKAIWKTKMEQMDNRLRVVTGEDIKYWYLHTRYEKGSGSLNSSCMQGEGAQSQINFYAQNPDSIALAILVSENDKLQARALLWRCVKPEGVIFMDRIYSVKPEHAKMLHNFAKENGIMTKTEGYNNKHKLEVKIKPYRGGWPYFDTFRNDQAGKNILTT